MSGAKAILDTGPLVALLNARDSLHAWAKEVFETMRGPYLTSEANITEMCLLLEAAQPRSSLRVMQMLADGLLLAEPFLPGRLAEVRAVMERYRYRSVDFADGCVVCLSNRERRLTVISADRKDFTVYFRGSNRRLCLPPS